MTTSKNKQNVRKLEYQKILQDSSFISISADNIEVLVAYVENKYIVFVDNEFEFDWSTTDEAGVNLSNHIALLSKIELLQQTPVVHYFSKKQKLTFARILGQAWVSALEDNIESCLETLKNAEKFVIDRNREISRKWHLFSSYCITAIILVLCHFNLLELYFLFSCLGSLMSILLKKSVINYDCQSGYFLNLLEIIGRFLIAFISANITLKLFSLDLIFSLFQTSTNKEIVILLISFASGFSERLIPSYISKINVD